MDLQAPIAPKTRVTVSALLAVHRRKNALLFVVVFFAVFSLTPLLILGGVTIGFGLLLGILVSLILAALIVRWPVIGFFVVAGCAVLVEEGNTPPTPILTNQLPIFYWPPSLEGLIERPIGFLFLFILFVLACRRLAKRQQALEGGALFIPFLFYLLCVAGGAVHGLATGGTLKIVVVELRPIWYLFVSYLLAYNLVTHKRDVRTFFWIVILGAGVKGVQGVYIFFIVLHGDLRFTDSLMAHEESFFFVAMLSLLILLCLHYKYRPQLYAALLVMPCDLVALVTNQRRADYIALLVAILVSWALIFLVKPEARKLLVVTMLISVVLGAAYVAAFAHSSGSLAAPARSIVSIVEPDNANARDASSNLYRLIENYDLKYTVKQNPLFGLGFGKVFLTPIPLPDISASDPYYLYIPHNTIYWIWMRLGPIGFFALWYLFGAIIVRGCIIIRQLRDPYLQLVAIYIVAVTFMEIIVAFADYQLFFYRNVIYLGLLVGLLMRLPALDEKKETLEYEHPRGVPNNTIPAGRL